MLRTTAIRGLLGGLALAAVVVQPAPAQQTPRGVDEATRSVVAVRAGERLVTGFRFGADGRVVTVAANGPFQVTLRNGVALSGDEVATAGGVTVLRVDAAGGRPLPAAPKGSARSGDAYLLGSPVGYADRARAARIGGPASARVVRGTLASASQGAPVVDRRGRLLGIVGARAEGGRKLVPAATVRRALSAESAGGDDGGRPLWQLLVLGFVLLAVVLAIITLIARRRARGRPASAETAPPPPTAALGDFAETQAQTPYDPLTAPTVSQPLVQRREPQQAPEPHEDFDIIFRAPRGEDG